MKDFTQGKILPQLISLALPIMGTGLAQLAYTFTNIFWLGRLSSEAVAAASIAGFISWITYALACTTKVGAEVGIAQAIGQKKLQVARYMAAHAITISLLMALAVSVSLLLFAPKIVGLFNLQQSVNEQCLSYLRILTYSMPLWFLNPTFSGIYNGCGNSRIPFYVSTLGILINLALDPFFIFGLGFFPRLEVEGAALSTALALVVEGAVFVVMLRRKKSAPLAGLRFFTAIKRSLTWRLLRVGAPASLQSALFAVFSMTLSAISASVGGYIGVAVQGAGGQIESLSWVTATGVATALGAYIGQNYGAQQMRRVQKSFMAGMGVVCLYGAVVSACFVLWGRHIFAFFIPADELVINEGARYLFIFGLSQVFLCAEIAATGAFNGLGRSYYPAIVSITLNAARIPAAIVLSRRMGLEGVWWAMCLSTLLKGIILSVTFPTFVKKIERQLSASKLRSI